VAPQRRWISERVDRALQRAVALHGEAAQLRVALDDDRTLSRGRES